MVLIAAMLLQVGSAQQPCVPTPRPSGAPSLVVQAVDASWLPLPGMKVTITPSGGRSGKVVAQTDRNGYAEFWLVGDGEHSIEVESPGFKKRSLKHLSLPKPSDASPTAYVQFQLEVSGPFVTVD